MAEGKTKYVLKKRSLNPAVRELAELHAQQPAGSEVKDSVEKSMDLLDSRDEYCRKNTMADTPKARMLSEKTYTIDWEQLHKEGKTLTRYAPIWMSGSGQGQLLQFLIRMQKAKNVLEIGMFTGYVAMAMAEALPEDGKVVTLEIDPHLVEEGRKSFDQTPYGNKIDIRKGPGLDSMDALASEGKTFDLVYLDADKDGYLSYFKKLMDKNLLAAGGTLAVDNTFEFGFAYTTPGSVVDEFNKFVMADDRVDQVMLGVYDGFSLIRRKGE